MAKTKESIINVNFTHKEKFTKLDRFALWITQNVGTMGFFLIIFGWTVFWLGWNIFAPSKLQFDPFPGFVFWLFISNMIQILLMPLIMIGQNLQARHAEIRAEADFKINVWSEEKIETITQQLENQKKLIQKILRLLLDKAI